MERRLTPSTYELVTSLVGLVGIFFTFRKTVLVYYFPNMAISATEWDFSNTLTNNVWAVVFFLLMVIIKILISKEEKALGYVTSVVMGISAADLVDKFVRGVRDKTDSDNLLLVLSISIPLLILYIEHRLPKLKQKLKNLWHLPK